MDTREKLLREGEKEIAISGFTNLSLREVARNLGLSNMAAYRHFTSKDDFLAEIASRTFEKFAQTLKKASETPSTRENKKPKSIHSKLTKISQAYFLFAKKKPDFFRLMFAGGFEHSVVQHPPDSSTEKSHVGASADRNDIYAVMRAAVAEYIDSSNLDDQEYQDEIDMYSFFCWCLVHGFCFIESEWFKDDAASSQERLNVLLELTLKTIGKSN